MNLISTVGLGTVGTVGTVKLIILTIKSLTAGLYYFSYTKTRLNEFQ